MHSNNSKYTYRLVDEGKEWGSLSTKNKVIRAILVLVLVVNNWWDQMG